MKAMVYQEYGSLTCVNSWRSTNRSSTMMTYW